ncbi:PREDICTED: uncharacterized protein LOC109587061 [Amphimedon queenslandica]|uniref:Uncharacterized protein n=1 Tax=Amphimedon queenslandica TaxID=400682 RepID=A0A1X7TLY2_AMPQE|nr:PREDICTED: uncharacterized protein LOC109587061 [Amphimedon queenslandica]|eukprot:XP_019858834.1 PREDICTED: uncharacterized protein LOC109587061 [Amphimedon queenslandica]
MEGGGREGEQLHFLIEKLLSLSPSSRNEKNLLQKLCLVFLSVEGEKPGAPGGDSRHLTCLSKWTDYPPLNVELEKEESVRRKISQWKTRFWTVFELVREDDKLLCTLLKEKWKEGVVRLISNLKEPRKDSESTFEVLSIGFCIVELCQERSTSENFINWSCSESLVPFLKKMTEEWLPWLRPFPEKHRHQTAVSISQWLNTLAHFIVRNNQRNDPPRLINVLTVLEKHIQAIMEAVTKSKDILYYYKIFNSLDSIQKSISDLYYLPIRSNEKLSLLQLGEWVGQCSSIMVERIIGYHVEKCRSTLLHSQVTYQGKHVSFSIQMWHYYLQCTSNDLNNLLHNDSLSLHIMTKILEKTLKTLTQHYVKTPPSSEKACRQYQADVTAILLTVCSLLPMIQCKEEKGPSSINALCLSLLHSLALFVSPLSVAKELIVTSRNQRRTLGGHIKWQECLPLDAFGLQSLYQHKEENSEEVEDMLLLLIMGHCGDKHSLLLKCLLHGERFRRSLLAINPQSFSAMANILMYFKPNYLLGLFNEHEINMTSDSKVTSVTLSWLREQLATPINNVLIDSAYNYILASMRRDELATLSVIKRLFENLPLLIKDVNTVVLQVLNQLISVIEEGTPTSKEFNGSQLVFGQLFDGLVQFSQNLSPPLSLVHILSHCNVFFLIVQQFFPPSPSPKSASQPGLNVALSLIRKLDCSLITSKLQKFHHLLTSKSSQLPTSDLMDSRLPSIAAEAITSDDQGKKSFEALEGHVINNKERLMRECLDASVSQFDVVRSCTHLNGRPFIDLFELEMNWEAVLKTELLLSQSIYKRVLLRWEMSSESLSEDDNQLVAQIKELIAS